MSLILKPTLLHKKNLKATSGSQFKMTMESGLYQRLTKTLHTHTNLSFKLMLRSKLKVIQYAHQPGATTTKIRERLHTQWTTLFQTSVKTEISTPLSTVLTGLSQSYNIDGSFQKTNRRRKKNNTRFQTSALMKTLLLLSSMLVTKKRD